MAMCKDNILTVLSQNLRLVRKERDLSIDLFADTCGLTSSALKSYLYGKSLPSIETLVSICNCYHISINVLFGDLIDFETEDKAITDILVSFQLLPDAKRGRVYGLIAPLVERMVQSSNLDAAGFSAKLKVCREDGGYSLRDFAQECDIAVNSLKAYECSQRIPGIEVFLTICRTLSVSPEYLLCNSFSPDYPYRVDKRFYGLTPLDLSALAVTANRLCKFYDELH